MAEALLDRHGIVTRGAVTAERVPAGFAAVYPVLKAAEEAGRAGAVTSSTAWARRSSRSRARSTGCDRTHANPTLLRHSCWPRPIRPIPTVRPCVAERPAGDDGKRGHQAARKAGALTVLVSGRCVLLRRARRTHVAVVRRGRRPAPTGRRRVGSGGTRTVRWVSSRSNAPMAHRW